MEPNSPFVLEFHLGRNTAYSKGLLTSHGSILLSTFKDPNGALPKSALHVLVLLISALHIVLLAS